jgi:hypothetical protein
VTLELQQAEQLVRPGRDRELLGRDPVDALAHEDVAEPVLHGRPVALHLLLRGDLLAEEVRVDGRRLAPERRLQRVGEGVRRVGGEHERSGSRSGATTGGTGGYGCLADPALARVENGPGRHVRAVMLGGVGPKNRW